VQIDWLIVAAQVLNFLLLVWLLKRFLYRPVLAAMARRQQHIGERLQAAEARERQAGQAQARYEAELERLEARRETLLAAARAEVDAERHALREQARAEIEATEARWRRDLQREQAEFLAELRREIGSAAQAVASQWMLELADADLQERMSARLLARVAALDPGTRETLAGSREGLTLRTAWPLDEPARAQIAQRLQASLGRPVPVQWVHDETLICGLALEGGGHRLDWDLADRLEGLAQRLQARLSALAVPAGAAPAGPA
jgi:F-type H+-transporting ATPase subunit b